MKKVLAALGLTIVALGAQVMPAYAAPAAQATQAIQAAPEHTAHQYHDRHHWSLYPQCMTVQLQYVDGPACQYPNGLYVIHNGQEVLYELPSGTMETEFTNDAYPSAIMLTDGCAVTEARDHVIPHRFCENFNRPMTRAERIELRHFLHALWRDMPSD
jgi:hypothetical protein